MGRLRDAVFQTVRAGTYYPLSPENIALIEAITAERTAVYEQRCSPAPHSQEPKIREEEDDEWAEWNKAVDQLAQTGGGGSRVIDAFLSDPHRSDRRHLWIQRIREELEDLHRHQTDFLREFEAPEPVPPPRPLRRSRRWRLHAGGREWTVPQDALENALEHVTKLLPARRVPSGLSEELRVVIWLSRPGRPRGSQAAPGRKGFVAKVGMTAAWAYRFVQAEMRKPSAERHPKIQRTALELADTEDWESYEGKERTWRIVTELLSRAFGDEWEKYGLNRPAGEDPDGRLPKAFYYTYISPRLSEVDRLISRRGLDSARNSYVRWLMRTI